MPARSPDADRSTEGASAAEAGAGRSVEDGAEGALSGGAGWAMAALLAVCFVGFPVAIVLWPPTFVPFQDAYLALSLVPGFLLGAAGVWTALRDRRRRSGR